MFVGLAVILGLVSLPASASAVVGGTDVPAGKYPAVANVVIADEGRGMAPRDDSPGLGLGLPLMATLTTTIEFHAPAAGGTEIWMTFATEGPQARAVWARTA